MVINDKELTLKIRPSDKGKNNSDAELANKAFKKISRISKRFKRGSSKGNPSYLKLLPNLQNSTVIAKYATNKTEGLWRAHGNYLARENSQKPGEKAFGFDASSTIIDTGEILDSWQKANDARLWKIIISPEMGELIDLKEHTRHFVKQVEIDLATSLSWVAVDHYNTDNPHVHLLIRGLDQDGNPLDINRNYLKLGLRLRSQEIATNQIGYRTYSQIESSREKQIDSDRFTSLDKAIIKRSIVTKDGLVFTLDNNLAISDVTMKYRAQLIRRLKKLEQLGLAIRTNKKWQIDPNLKDKLRDVGRLAAGLKILERHRNKMTAPNQELTYNKLNQAGESLIGRILGGGIDPDTDKPYLLIEAIDGKAHYVTQNSKIQAGRLQSELSDGNLVTIKVKSFEVNERGVKKTIEYLETKDFGAKLDNQLVDDYILSSLKNQHNPLAIANNSGFAGKFLEAVASRIDILKLHNIVVESNNAYKFQHNWKNNYDRLIGKNLSADIDK
jgi:hypothetical protein